jgi:hypothetical protein
MGERQVQSRRRKLPLIRLGIRKLLEPKDYTPCKLSVAISSKSRSQCYLQARSKARNGLLCEFRTTSQFRGSSYVGEQQSRRTNRAVGLVCLQLIYRTPGAF